MSSYRDLLAELELAMVPSTRPRPEDHAGRGIVEDHEGGGTRLAHFWCSVKKQEVEVEFETQPRRGLRRIVDVRRCSAFDRPMDVACGRHCLDASFRTQHPFSPPLLIQGSAIGD
jgi:hypothetical protein